MVHKMIERSFEKSTEESRTLQFITPLVIMGSPPLYAFMTNMLSKVLFANLFFDSTHIFQHLKAGFPLFVKASLFAKRLTSGI